MEWTESCAVSSLLAFDEKEFEAFADTAWNMKNGINLTHTIFSTVIRDRKTNTAMMLAESIRNISVFEAKSLYYSGRCFLIADRLSEAKAILKQAFEVSEKKYKLKKDYFSGFDFIASCYYLAKAEKLLLFL